MIEFAEDGQRCLELVSSSLTGDYNLILMDINMPVMNGLETMKRLRQMDFARPIDRLDRKRRRPGQASGADAGIGAFVEKPAHVEKLFSEMAKA